MGYNDDGEPHVFIQSGGFFDKHPDECPLCACVWEEVELEGAR